MPRRGPRKIKASPGRPGVTVSRRRACRIIGGGRPGRRMRQEEVQGAPRGGQRGRRAERRRVGLGGRAPRTHICGDLAYVCVGASWSCARLLVDPRNRGDRRPLRRARKGRPAGQAGVRDALLPDPGHRDIPHGPRQRVRQSRDRPDARGLRHREVAVGKGPPPRQRRRRVDRRDAEGRARPPRDVRHDARAPSSSRPWSTRPLANRIDTRRLRGNPD